MPPARILRPLAVLAIMGAGVLIAQVMRPAPAAPSGATFQLDAMVPERFGDWHRIADGIPLLPAPELQASIDRTYDQIVERTYADGQGRTIMLSIAYSGNYDKSMQWHRPEHCYPSQGFTIEQPTHAVDLPTEFGRILAAQLVAQRGKRIEPITYWFVLGERQARFGLDLRWHQVLYGLSGRVPDGLLVRVSSVDPDLKAAFESQRAFAADLVAGLRAKDRPHFLGRESRSS